MIEFVNNHNGQPSVDVHHSVDDDGGPFVSLQLTGGLAGGEIADLILTEPGDIEAWFALNREVEARYRILALS